VLSAIANVRLNGVRSRDGDEEEGARGVGLGVSRRGGGGIGACKVSHPRCTESSSKRPRNDVGNRAEGLIVGTDSDESTGKVSGNKSSFNAA
jgi:hypothetical protein